MIESTIKDKLELGFCQDDAIEQVLIEEMKNPTMKSVQIMLYTLLAHRLETEYFWTGNIDFVFVKLDSYLKEFPDSIHVPQARFAVCEYYFQIKDYRSAIYKLRDYIIDFPEEKATIFAQLFLYKILSEYRKEPALTEKIKESLFSKSVFLVFSDAKVKYYKSLLNNIYRILNYVDKIEVFKNNDLFLRITP